MSHRCLESLKESQSDGMCGPAQNGHCGLLLAVVTDFLAPARSESVGGTTEAGSVL